MAGMTAGKNFTGSCRTRLANSLSADAVVDFIVVAAVALGVLLASPFSVMRKTLTICVSGEGQTNPIQGKYEYRLVKRVQLHAIPSAGWKLENWEIDGERRYGDNCSVLMLRTHNVQAVFKRERAASKQERMLRMLQPDGDGRVIPEVGEHILPKDQMVSIKAIPEVGKRFKCWYIDTSQVYENKLEIKMNKDRTVQAVFVRDTLTEKERIEVQDLISATMQTIASSIEEAKKSKNSANLKGLDLLQHMVEVLYQRIEDGQTSFEDAKKELLSFQRYAEGLGKPLPTLYDLLKVNPKAHDQEIRAAFSEMIQQYHPDKFPNLPEWLRLYCEEMTRKLIEARDILLDEERRKKYDESIGV